MLGRSLLTRQKTIHHIQCERINAHWLVVDVETSAGTYVKVCVRHWEAPPTASTGASSSEGLLVCNPSIAGYWLARMSKAADLAFKLFCAPLGILREGTRVLAARPCVWIIHFVGWNLGERPKFGVF